MQEGRNVVVVINFRYTTMYMCVFKRKIGEKYDGREKKKERKKEL